MCEFSIYINDHHAEQRSSYPVEAIQLLLDLGQCRVHSANFDLWVLPLCVQTVSNNSARIAVRKRTRDSDTPTTLKKMKERQAGPFNVREVNISSGTPDLEGQRCNCVKLRMKIALALINNTLSWMRNSLHAKMFELDCNIYCIK